MIATVISVLAGTLCAIGCWRPRTRASEFVRSLMLVPIVVPTIVHARGIYRFWVDLRLLDTYTGIIVVHAVTGIPYVVITVSTALAGFDLKLERAARSLGASTPDHGCGRHGADRRDRRAAAGRSEDAPEEGGMTGAGDGNRCRGVAAEFPRRLNALTLP